MDAEVLHLPPASVESWYRIRLKWDKKVQVKTHVKLCRAVALMVIACLLPGCDPRWNGADWTRSPDGRRSLILPDATGESHLVVPPVCWRRTCPLVIVSHGRGGQASDGRDRKPFNAMLSAIDAQGFVLLLSSDGGGDTWGSPAGLNTLRRAYRAALPRFRHDGRVYTLGVSMGGLPAALTAYRHTLGFSISAVAVVGGWVNLRNAVRTSKSRTRAVEAAYGRASRRGHDPVGDFGGFVGKRTPLLVVSSPQDRSVAGNRNGLLLVKLARKAGAQTKVIAVTGAHMNRRYVNAEIGQQIGEFFRAHR